MFSTTITCAVIVLVGVVDSRRPRAASPQERRAKPGLQLPTAEDLVGAMVPSRWKWPIYPEQRPPTLGEWRQGHKPGEWVWRGDRRVLEAKDNRWNPYFIKKPTGLEKKKQPVPAYPKKFLGPKFQKQKRPGVKVGLAPVADLRPKSIDRIDILRPQHQIEAEGRFVQNFNSLKTTGQIGGKTAVQIGGKTSEQLGRKTSGQRGWKTSGQIGRKTAGQIGGKTTGQIGGKTTGQIRGKTTDQIGGKTAGQIVLKPVVDEKQAATTSTTAAPSIEVDGIQIYMFRGDEGIGGYKPPKVQKYQQNQILPAANSQKKIQWSKAELKPQKPKTLRTTSHPTVSPYRQSPPVTPQDIAPPFPTRHTTNAPNHENQPIVIIAQSNVAQNYD